MPIVQSEASQKQNFENQSFKWWTQLGWMYFSKVPIEDFQTGYSLNEESGEPVEGAMDSEQRGMARRHITFSALLDSTLQEDIMSVFVEWENFIGIGGVLYFGNKSFGGRWFLKSVDCSDSNFDTLGRLRSMKLNFVFDEVVDPGKENTFNTYYDTLNGITTNEVVQFLGGPHFMSSTSKVSSVSSKPGPAKVTGIVKGALHPFHVSHTDKTTEVYGWVDASQLEKIKKESGANAE